MTIRNNYYTIQVKKPHVDWGTYRNPTNREPIEGESYVKIPSSEARKFDIRRGKNYMAHFKNGMSSMPIKASGNGPFENGVQYAKQFEGVGEGACKAFTPWYRLSGIEVGDWIKVEFLSSKDIEFSKL